VNSSNTTKQAARCPGHRPGGHVAREVQSGPPIRSLTKVRQSSLLTAATISLAWAITGACPTLALLHRDPAGTPLIRSRHGGSG
jgi:hypothetical protein